jgi:hypothetical protein
LRVLKPGGYLLAFAGTRTQHRMAVRIEDAGFEIRDMIAWVYGSGFPKSLNIGKAVDKLQGNERVVVGEQKLMGTARRMKGGNYGDFGGEDTADVVNLTKGTSEWEGYGTALKPALEPITVARKPISEKTVAQNVLKYGTGGINIDGCRVEAIDGRFPANLIHDGSDEVVSLFPETAKSSGGRIGNKGSALNMMGQNYEKGDPGFGDSGSAARYFYCAKASKSERNKGLDSTLTVKYNNSISLNKEICKEENTVAVQLLQKVISEQELVSFNTDESGVNIMVQCHRDSLSTTLTTINKTIESKILNSLMHLLTNEYTQVANSEMETGGNLVENVESLRKWILTITKGKTELALGANNVALQTLLKIKEEENWNQKTNIHSTVKPISLMQYLVRLVTPKGGTVLDPFMGSGTTGIGAKLEGFDFIGIEREAEYIKIAEARINAWEKDK